MLRIINLSHNDLDGIASAIAIRTAHPQDHVKTEFVSNAGVHYALKKACEAKVPWDRIILSDVSIKIPTDKTTYSDERQRDLVESLPGIIRTYVDNGGEFVVVDHHETAIPMKFFFNSELHQDSILQVNDEEGNPIAGSELAARYMVAKLDEMEDTVVTAEVMPVMDDDNEDEVEFQVVEYDIFTLSEYVVEFCRIAGDLDVWRDPFGFGGKLALALELMEDEHGAMEDFFGIITTAITKQCGFEEALEESPVMNYYYSMANNKLAGALSLAERNCVEYAPNLHHINVRFFPDHCAENIYRKTNGIVLITYPNSKRISFRKHKDIDINLGKFCKRYGGGGHAASAGMDIPKNMTFEDVVSEILAELENIA